MISNPRKKRRVWRDAIGVALTAFAGVAVVAFAGSGVTPTSVTPSQGNCTVGVDGELDCDIGDLAAGQTVTVVG